MYLKIIELNFNAAHCATFNPLTDINIYYMTYIYYNIRIYIYIDISILMFNSLDQYMFFLFVFVSSLNATTT